MNVFLDLFLTFARVGLLTFGGGYAMLPIIQKEVVENKKWTTKEELMDYYALSQCTPGAIAVNTATFIGYKIKGILGGIIATLGVVLPSLIIIIIIAAFINNFLYITWVKKAFNAINICICVLILNAVINLGKSSIKDVFTLIIFIIISLLSILTNISPIIFIITSAILSIILQNIGGTKK
ncbi:chromate transporter [Clostridium sp. MSJ-8]|uniref:chromate transporter n=1 Tax=Clostridium sp. MSJ-8 TaxID=2841510 RepID=UPI001C0ECD4B|nr:chromate transporter [Clostridium sp. MSJ-8]MBU5488859.1 chromate transporter [Clostridium sp. MSJ-8]